MLHCCKALSDTLRNTSHLFWPKQDALPFVRIMQKKWSPPESVAVIGGIDIGKGLGCKTAAIGHAITRTHVKSNIRHVRMICTAASSADEQRTAQKPSKTSTRKMNKTNRTELHRAKKIYQIEFHSVRTYRRIAHATATAKMAEKTAKNQNRVQC